MSQWWVTEPGKDPIGPMAEEAVVHLVRSGGLPRDGLVCVVGGDRWRPLEEIPVFAAALGAMNLDLHRFDDRAEKTIVDDHPLAMDDDLDEPEEHTLADRLPSANPKRRA